MDFYKNIPFFSIVLLMAASMICGVMKRKYAKTVTFCVTCIVAAMGGYLLLRMIQTGESYSYMLGHTSAPWGNELKVGLLEVFTAFSFTVIFLLSFLGGWNRIDAVRNIRKENFTYVALDLLLASMFVLIYTNDVFTAYVFIEINTIAACGLVISTQSKRALVATTKYLIMSLLGSSLFLIGLTFLYSITGQLLMPYVKEALADNAAAGRFVEIIPVLLGLFMIALTMKSGLFPFYAWIPDFYGNAPAAGSAILSGIVSKAYIFLFIKLIYQVIGKELWFSVNITTILYVFGLISMILGSVLAIAQKDIKRMIAYSSVAQIGYIYMGIGLSNDLGIYAALFHIFSHGVSKALLFISADGLSKSSNDSRKFLNLSGSGYRNVAAGIGFSVGSFSLIGIPLFAGFISKINFAEACLEAPSKTMLTLFVLAVSTILNAIYFLRAMIVIYTPKKDGENRLNAQKPGTAFLISIAAFTALNLFLGIGSKPVMDLIRTGVSNLMSASIK